MGAVALPGVELKVKEELGEELGRGMAGAVALPRDVSEENATAEQPLPSQSGPKGAERAHAPGLGRRRSLLRPLPAPLDSDGGRGGKPSQESFVERRLTARGSCLVRLFALRHQAR